MMKRKFLSYLASGILAGFAISIVIETVGCGTVGSTSYKTVGVTQVSVQTGLELWNQAIPILKPSIQTQYKVRAGFDKWKAGTLLVCDAGAAYAASIGTTNETITAAALQYAITHSDQDKNDFLNLLVEAGVKLPTH